MFEVFLTNRAEKALKSFDVKLRRRIEPIIDIRYKEVKRHEKHLKA